MTTASLAVDGKSDLSELQTIAQQNEQNIGPLTTLSISNNNTLLTFFFANTPTNPVELSVYSGHPEQKAGKSLVCAGTCLVNGASQQVAAYRQI